VSARHYAVAVAAPFAIAAVRLALEPIIGNQTPFLLFALATVLASWFGGLGPGLVATLLSSAIISLLFPVDIDLAAAAVVQGAFLTQGVLISLLGESLLRSQRRVEREKALFEARVAERTAELTRANLALEHSNRELESFASVASHDLQEPLRKIRAFGDRLREISGDRLDPVGLDHLERMRDAAGRMQTLIDDLLAFSRVATRVQPSARVQLETLALAVIEDLESRIETTGGMVRVGKLPEVEADPVQMRQLLQNLIANALKFHRPGVPPVVELDGCVDGDQVELTVRDNGIGFEPRYAERIFGVFQRLHGRGAYEGTGIGLAICRRIAEQHGGTIRADAAPGEGAVFTIRLPREQAVERSTATDRDPAGG
jgi:light-regulated signal transduction histidine kinase (bacteriophytochrome)